MARAQNELVHPAGLEPATLFGLSAFEAAEFANFATDTWWSGRSDHAVEQRKRFLPVAPYPSYLSADQAFVQLGCRCSVPLS